jgi:CHAT domain-containing protein
MRLNLVKSIKQIFSSKLKNSFWLLLLLFILSATIPPVVAEVNKPTPIVQRASEPQQLVRQAKNAYQQGDFATASELWQQAITAFTASQDSLNQAMALSNLSLTQQQLGQWEQANKTLQQSLELLATVPVSSNQQQVLAQSLDVRGQIQQDTGKAADALDSWQQATNIYQQLKDTDAVNQSKINQAQALTDLGLYPRACDTLITILEPDLQVSTCPAFNRLTTKELTAKLEQITTQKNNPTTFLALRSLGNLLTQMGQVKQAELVLNTSLTLAKTFKDNQELATTYLNLGNVNQILYSTEKVRRKRNKYRDTALSYFDKTRELATSSITKQQAQLNKLSFLLQLENWSEADTLANSLIIEVNQLPSNQTKINAQINLAYNLIEILDKAPANEVQLPSVTAIDSLLEDAALQARNLGNTRLEAYALGNRGHLAEIQANFPPAETYTKQAIELVSNFDAPDVSYQYFWQLGRIEKTRGDLQAAIAAYTKAYDALQYLRSDLTSINPELQLSFRDRVEPVYRELVELNIKYASFLDQAGRDEEKTSQLVQARNVIESLQIAQLNNFFREVCIEGNPQVIDNIDPKAAVIYPIILSDQLEILLSLPNQTPKLYSTSITASEISETVAQIKAALLSPSSSIEAALPLYQQAYNWLIRPLEQQLTEAKVKTIAFVLDGDLRNIPMSVLHNGQQYLVEKYAVALTPGLQLLDPKPITALKLEVVTAGLSEIPQDFQQQFAPLPGVKKELADIQQIGLAKESLLDEQFTQKALKKEITTSGSPIIHLATHATFSSNPENTFILTWDEPIKITELDDLLRDDTFNRKEAIELLVLSACETASGDDNATLGLAGVAVQSGARSTLATLWSVVDESTAQIMSEFYSQLIQSGVNQTNKAEALRQAQLSLIASKNFNHPHFWSPFILIGNWQ